MFSCKSLFMAGGFFEPLHKCLHPGSTLIQFSCHLLNTTSKSSHYKLLLLAEDSHLIL